MNSLEIPIKAISPSALWLDLQDLESGEISPDRREQLVALLDRSKDARKLYLEYFEQVALLEEEAKILVQSETIPLWQDRIRRGNFFKKISLAAAAVIGLSAVAVTFFTLTAETPRLAVKASPGTIWEVDGASGKDGFIVEGATISVLSGNLSIHSELGLDMIVEGPSEITFAEINRPFLKQGALWVDSSAFTGDFHIDTQNLLVSDVGTRFGVAIGHDEKAEVHLVTGQLEITLDKTGKTVATMNKPGSSLAINKNGESQPVSLLRDPFDTAGEVFTEQSDYANVLTGQIPSSYWRFSENEGGGTIIPAHGLTYGFGVGNTCLDLRGGEIPDFTAQSGPSTSEGSLSLWVRRESDIGKPEILWTAPRNNESLTLCILADGIPTFQVAQGDNSLVLKGDRSIADGEWHHLALTWSFEKTEMFLDAELIAKGYGVRSNAGERSPNESFRLDISFQGLVDELAVWNRALAPAEVSAQYSSVRNPKIALR